MTVDFATFCCAKDRDKLYESLHLHIDSHSYAFNDVHVIHQMVKVGDLPLTENMQFYQIKEEDIDVILEENGINPNNAEADKYTHGKGAAHYWKAHCVNHLKALSESTADYIVLSDADCHMTSKTDWINEGIVRLRANPLTLVVSPP